MSTPGIPSAVIVALASALLDALTLAGVFHLDSVQKTAILTVLTSVLGLAGVFIPVFQHRAGMARIAARRSNTTP
jgi:hypothetical protein